MQWPNPNTVHSEGLNNLSCLRLLLVVAISIWRHASHMRGMSIINFVYGCVECLIIHWKLSKLVAMHSGWLIIYELIMNKAIAINREWNFENHIFFWMNLIWRQNVLGVDCGFRVSKSMSPDRNCTEIPNFQSMFFSWAIVYSINFVAYILFICRPSSLWLINL